MSDRAILKSQERIAQLSVAGWGATLIILLTLNQDSWLGQLIAHAYADAQPNDFLHVLAGFVSAASVGFVAAAFFLIAETRTRKGWAGVAAVLSFFLLVGVIGILLLNAMNLGFVSLPSGSVR